MQQIYVFDLNIYPLVYYRTFFVDKMFRNKSKNENIFFNYIFSDIFTDTKANSFSYIIEFIE